MEPGSGAACAADIDRDFRWPSLVLPVKMLTRTHYGAKIEDILSDMRRNPAGVRFVDVCKVATHYFGEPRQSGTSHKVWKMPWAGDPRVNLQKAAGSKAKAYQVRQLVEAIDLLERAKSESRG